MPDRPALADVLPPIESIDTVPAELLPGLVAGLAALQARAAARLAVVEPGKSASNAGRLLDARKVASMLDTTPHAVYDLQRTGKLRGVRVGKRRLRFREEDVLALGGDGVNGDGDH